MPVTQVLALAEQHRRGGDLAAAENLCRQILRARPTNTEALHLLGIMAHQVGKLPIAIDFLRRAVALKSEEALYHANLGEMCRQLGQLDEAIAEGKRALELKPDYAPALSNLGIAYFDQEDYTTAERCYRRALAIDPKFAEAHSNLGNALRAQHKFEQAIPAYNRAIELRPGFCDAIANLGTVLHITGQIEEAISTYRRALTLDPLQANAHAGLGILFLLKGNFEEGWSEYEWRLRMAESKHRLPQGPVWDGSDPSGRRILVYMEQGFGDTIQFCRYLPMLRERGALVSARMTKQLASLVAHNMAWLDVTSEGPLPPYDCHCPLLSLAHRFRTRLETIPRAISYLRPLDAPVARWAERLGGGSEFKIGVAWTGNPKHINNLNRSAPVEAMDPLLAVEGVRFVSLQVGARANELTVHSNGAVPDLSPDLTDYAETAGVVANLDLVIAVDTSVAHLAGALGEPTWMILSWVPDWRWLLECEDSPWYPTMRVFRQRAPGDWRGVAERVAAELRLVLAGERGRLVPFASASAG